MYHSVNNATTKGFAQFTVTPTRFREHLAALRAAGWTTVTFAEAADRLRAGRPAERLVAVTIDDGLADFHEHALPILESSGTAATLFVPTAHIGGVAGWLTGEDANRPLLGWPQLREVVSTGIEIGSHGHRHIPVDVGPHAEMLDEFTRSRAILEDRLGISVTTLAYPFGYQSPATRRMAMKAGYVAACAVVGMPARGGDPHAALPRIAMTQDMDGQALLHCISRSYSAMERRWKYGKQVVWELARRTGRVGPASPAWSGASA
jgi:peptidoglycan/xylan/chitin deacetylase (PgdA/CDA1 family)